MGFYMASLLVFSGKFKTAEHYHFLLDVPPKIGYIINISVGLLSEETATGGGGGGL